MTTPREKIEELLTSVDATWTLYDGAGGDVSYVVRSGYLARAWSGNEGEVLVAIAAKLRELLASHVDWCNRVERALRRVEDVASSSVSWCPLCGASHAPGKCY